MKKRTFQIEVGNVRDADQRTIDATLSTTYPVKRYDGEEVLSHDPEAVDLSRAPLPLITSHDSRQLPVGVVEKLEVIDGKLKGVLRISSTKEEIWEDIQGGILRNLSVGYFVKSRKRTANGFLVTKWQPYECSLVAAGADPAAGIGRSIFKPIRKENRSMDLNDILKAKKRAVDELTELAMTENLDDAANQRFETLKGEIRGYDTRIEALELAQAGKDDLQKRGDAFQPTLDKKNDRNILNVSGGPVADRSYAGMFNQGREIQIDEAEIQRFRDTMTSGVGADGGLAVPEPVAAKWLDESLPNEIIRPRAQVWPMTSGTIDVIGWDTSDLSGGDFFGGFAMEFLGETQEGTKQKGKLRTVLMRANKGAIFVDISNELREDGTGFESQLERAMKTSLSLGMDYHFLRGTGVAQPLGILNHDSLISVAKETDQAADSIVFENAAKMFARMYPAGRSKAVWIANETCIPSLMSLYVPTGDTGQVLPVFKDYNGQPTLFGRPVLFSSNLPTVGDANDLIFVDLSQYAIGLRRDMRLEKSNIPGWTQDLMSYRVLVRFDGMGVWDSVLTPRNGDTLSWCVGLAERA
ncbi:phage major capsid protein, HK97 family [Desulfosarcina variabilis str. Montpellier]|uniref:phage major capsid protein n=1 Tax=Desulfosarcina variabilis TaxID=2300 RepID=UPI003AFA6515